MLPKFIMPFRQELLLPFLLSGFKNNLLSGVSQESDLRRLHEDAIKNDPFVSKALGPNPKMERMKAASLRLGGQGLTTTFDDHLMILGDAAGHIDPLTGEGIHTAIMVCPLGLADSLFGVNLLGNELNIYVVVAVLAERQMRRSNRSGHESHRGLFKCFDKGI